MDVNFLCNFNSTGVGRHCENAFFGMMRNRRGGIVPHYVNQMREPSVRRLLSDPRAGQGATVMFWRWPLEAMRAIPGRKIGWLFFESDRIPPMWIEQMLAFDQLWMPSEWGRDVLLAHGVAAERIRVVPSGVDCRVYRPDPRPHEGFVFLTVGKYEERKSIDETIEAFVAEFPAAQYPEVALWVKADHPVFPDRVEALRRRHGHEPRIRVLSGVFSDEQMAALYNGADAFVFPSKAEGFGLPCIEALACGLPVITTDYSAQTVFLKHVAGLFRPVAYELAELRDPDYAHFYAAEYAGTPFGRWAVPSVASIRAAMREVHDDHDAWRLRAREASERIRPAFSWDSIGCQAVEAILDGS
jgi:glycosyltransferase involved in cell wall biosynthesis